jgi:hypothetical protein
MDAKVTYPDNLLIDSTGYDGVKDERAVGLMIKNRVLPEAYKQRIADAEINDPEEAEILKRLSPMYMRFV